MDGATQAYAQSNRLKSRVIYQSQIRSGIATQGGSADRIP
jgi:hypothetical protein